MEQDRKMEEREKKKSREEKGYNFPRMINFHSQWNLYFLWQLARDFWPSSRSFSCHPVVTFQAMNTRLWRQITYKKPSRALQRKITQSGTAVFHAIINMSAATVLPQYWPPTLGMHDSLGEEKGCTPLLSNWLQAALEQSYRLIRRDPVRGLCLLTDTTSCTERVGGGTLRIWQ